MCYFFAFLRLPSHLADAAPAIFPALLCLELGCLATRPPRGLRDRTPAPPPALYRPEFIRLDLGHAPGVLLASPGAQAASGEARRVPQDAIKGEVECGVSPLTTARVPQDPTYHPTIAMHSCLLTPLLRFDAKPGNGLEALLVALRITTVDAVRAGHCCPASHPDAARRARTVACGAEQDRCGQPRPTPSPRRPPKGSAARGPGPGQGQADRSKPPTRRSSTASSLMVEATRARRRRPRRKIDGAMMCLWPRLN